MTWQSIGKAFGPASPRPSSRHRTRRVVAGSLAGRSDPPGAPFCRPALSRWARSATERINGRRRACSAVSPARCRAGDRGLGRPCAGRALAARGRGDVRPAGRRPHHAVDRRGAGADRPDRPVASQPARRSICATTAVWPSLAILVSLPALPDCTIRRADAQRAAGQGRCARILHRHQQAADPGGAHRRAGGRAVAALASRGARRHQLGTTPADRRRGGRLCPCPRRDGKWPSCWPTMRSIPGSACWRPSWRPQS